MPLTNSHLAFGTPSPIPGSVYWMIMGALSLESLAELMKVAQ